MNKPIFLLLFLFTQVVFAQNMQNMLRLQGKVVEGKQKLGGVQIILYSQGEVLDRMTTEDNGKFIYKVPLESNYELVFYKPGYRSKYLQIFAKHIPQEDASYGFEFGGLELALFKEISSLKNQEVLDKPVAQIKYDTNTYKFVFDASYFQELQEESEALAEELANIEADPQEKKQLEIQAQQQAEEEKKQLDNQALMAMEKQKIVAPEMPQMPIQTKPVSPSKPPVVIEKPLPAKPLNTASKPEQIKTIPSTTISSESKTASVKPKTQAKDGLLSKEIFRKGNKTITEIQIQRQGQIFSYRRVVADWGGRYFFKDEVPITEISWQADLGVYLTE